VVDARPQHVLVGQSGDQRLTAGQAVGQPILPDRSAASSLCLTASKARAIGQIPGFMRACTATISRSAVTASGASQMR
jgi:hypothetical protein